MLLVCEVCKFEIVGGVRVGGCLVFMVEEDVDYGELEELWGEGWVFEGIGLEVRCCSI